MGQFVEDMEGHVREHPVDSSRPISVFDMQTTPAEPVADEKPAEPVKLAAKVAADPEGGKK